ncbi:MAG: hypothetical protein MN733_02990 [Nitrososphaera sp.]|nr:hypothetical protein [Nitrososphaera sp.]
MAANNNRNKVLQHVADQLATITIANGYNTDVATVSRILMVPQQISGQYPALFVTDTGIEAPIDRTIASQIAHLMTIEILGYFQDTSADISKNYNLLIADIWKVIYAPIIFNDGQKYAERMDIVGLETMSEASQDITFRISLSVIYWFDKSNP